MRRLIVAMVASAVLAATVFVVPAMALTPITLTSPTVTTQVGDTWVPSITATNWVDITTQYTQGYRQYTIGVDVHLVPTSDTVPMLVWFTTDNGATTIQGCGIDPHGGVQTNRLGQTSNYASCNSFLPAPGSGGLKVAVEVQFPVSVQSSLQATLT